MTERDQMVIALVKEVLGPRQGSHEILPEESDPRSEYITGVLEPERASTADIRIEDEVDEVIEEISGEEDQDTQGFVASPGVFSPALDPKALPRSIGISFTIACNQGVPQVEICTTWAHYYLENDGWHRNPNGFLTGPVDAGQQEVDWYPPVDPGVRIHMRSHMLRSGLWRVSIFLINTTVVANQYPQTGDYLFQPQIRVSVGEHTEVIPVDFKTNQSAEDDPDEREDLSLGLLYRSRLAMARGHMCGAMWEDIDPERPFPSPQPPDAAPYIWTDAEVIPEPERIKFSPARVRSELVPVYLVQSPEMQWLSQYGPAPQLDPAILAETWQPKDVLSALQPLVDGYRAWITDQENQVNLLEPHFRPAAQAHLQICTRTVNRIEEAIQVLCNDEDARLAFCFANKAIEMQARWKNSARPLIWRSFQLAFILLNIPPLATPTHPDRNICDLLWFPTGGGKTEAYLGLAAFVLGLRRLRAKNNDPAEDRSGGGVGVLSRYTLRLLTIQQFRRALGVITACEVLRVSGLTDQNQRGIGWRPQACSRSDNFLWGGMRFSLGLWVGGGVTPNRLHSIGPMPVPNGNGMMMIAGALHMLRGLKIGYDGLDRELQSFAQQVRNRLEVEGEPAQITHCPCCHGLLSVPDKGLEAGQHTLHLIYQGGNPTHPQIALIRPNVRDVVVDNAQVYNHPNSQYRYLSLTITIPENKRLTADQIDEWWVQKIAPALGQNIVLQSARAARPGYFILTYRTNQKTNKGADFEIHCPNPHCELNQQTWAEQVPLSREYTGTGANQTRQLPLDLPAAHQNDGLPVIIMDRLEWENIPETFKLQGRHKLSGSIPIPAMTVDDQVYHRCPSMVIATVDKFARLPFEAKAASLFGNVTHYHSRWGYYREGCPPSDGGQRTTFQGHPPGLGRNNPLHCDVLHFAPPDLILQDELHLIEGPLGSMVGLYEMVIDILCQRMVGGQLIIPKYIASTATVRQAETQVQALFNRQLMQFPPSAISADERFFATDHEAHPLDNNRPGRLYAAVCAPGKGAQTPIIRIWSSLLQNAYLLSQTIQANRIDPFWTLVGYFNATRELAGALSLYRQDIPERIGTSGRDLDDANKLELSSRASSTNLPVMLQKLERSIPGAIDAVFATSMFGTGVDIDRLSLMVMHGQPKTTSAYIQATGRVGRQVSGLVVSFFRASRPRDLDHYEFFTGYHRALYRYVEPVTVAPFSPRAREKCLGPLSVALLRQARVLNGNIHLDEHWRVEQRIGSGFYSEARRMTGFRYNPEVQLLPDLFENRAQLQPMGRRPAITITAQETASELDRWRSIASLHPDPNLFVYFEPAVLRQPARHVVLGDSQHHMRFDEAYENAPQSLRDVEETTGFKA